MWTLLTGIFLFSGTTGCIHRKPKLPCWVTRPCGDYLDREYIIGVGSGETSKIADDEAVAAVAKHFQVNVQQTQRSQKETTQFTDESGVRASGSQNLQTDTIVSVAMELRGVQIVERHQQTNSFFSLAVLERAPLLADLDKELAGLQSQLEKLIGLAKGSGSKIDKAHYYHQAIPLIDQIELLSSRRVIVDYQDQPWSNNVTASQLRTSETDALHSIQMSLKADPTAQEISPVLVEAFQAKGFVFSADEDIDLLVEMKATEGMIPPDQFGFKKTKFTLDLKIYEPKQQNRLLFSRQFTAQVASQSLFKSRELAIKQVKEQMLANNIGQGLTNRILGEQQ